MLSMILVMPLAAWLLPSSLLPSSAAPRLTPDAPPVALPSGAPPRSALEAASPLRLQVLLDRANFSPGEIDGVSGSNEKRAFDAFSRATVGATHGLDEDVGEAEGAWHALNTDFAPTLVGYTSTEQDHSLEALGEKFHCSQGLLRTLNPRATFTRSGELLQVPNVGVALAGKAASVVLDKSDSSVEALDASGQVIASYPATMGRGPDPFAIDTWTIGPSFLCDPALSWNAAQSQVNAAGALGPNPVGVAWLDLYGIHGTPDDSRIGQTSSRGCVRLTNWDAAELSHLVSAGTRAVLQE
jgi:hypothetical protein